MKLLLGLCALFQLFLPSSSFSFCGIQRPMFYKNKAHTWGQRWKETLEAPWLVNIIGNGRKCQGVLMSNWWVLTAANCFLLMKPSYVELTGVRGRFFTIKISQFLTHQAFALGASPNNDVGLILLKHPVDLRRYDIWPICMPHREAHPNTLAQCKLVQRGQDGPRKSLLKEFFVYLLVTSECAVHWPNTSKRWSFCLARKMSNPMNCKVPVGSPVICRDPSSKRWEIMGLVSQSLHGCTAPVLATQLVPHLRWLLQQGAMINSLQPQAAGHRPSFPAARLQGKNYLSQYNGNQFSEGQSFKTHTTSQPLPGSLQVPVMLPDAKQPSEVSQTTKQPQLETTMTAEHTTTETATTPATTATPAESTTPVSLWTVRQPPAEVTQIVFVEPPSTVKQSAPEMTATESPHQTTPEPHLIVIVASTNQVSSHAPATPDQQPSEISTSSPSAAPAAVPSPHIIIIPATTEQLERLASLESPLVSPDSIIVPPTLQLPSSRPPSVINQGGLIPFIAAGPQSPKSKRDESTFPDTSVTLLSPPTTAIPFISSLEPSTQVPMEQCKLELAWDSASHTYQLNKMEQVLIEHRAGCGLRPGFVPKCPSCSEAEMGEFPWIVSLKLSIQHFCAGTILNPWWILTTANCANLIKNSEALAVVQAGLVDVSEGLQLVPVRQAVAHPHSLANQDLHNLGLLELEKPLEFGPFVAPVCVSDKADLMDDFRDCWLPGWTVLEGGPTTLLRRPLETLIISNCNQLGAQLSSEIFCIEAQSSQGGGCKGDVGSPLICPDPQSGAWVQLGMLSSFDEACLHPYVFSSLSNYLPWVEGITQIPGRPDNFAFLKLQQEPEILVKQISVQFSQPWQVLVATCRNRKCGGSILDQYWVLTTAHCIQEADGENTAVFVGLTHPSGYAKGIRVAAVYPYENNRTGGDNVALLLLQQPITFDLYVTPMTFTVMKSWHSCKVMGLQMLEPGEVPIDPTAFPVKVLLPSECAKEHPEVNPATYCILRGTESQPPPPPVVAEGAALMCHMKAKSEMWSQVGLTSEPFPGSQPVALASSIASYVDWVEETSQKSKGLLSLTTGRAASRPSSWGFLLILSLFGGIELG